MIKHSSSSFALFWNVIKNAMHSSFPLLLKQIRTIIKSDKQGSLTVACNQKLYDNLKRYIQH